MKIIIYFLFFAAIVFTSCKKEKDPVSTPAVPTINVGILKPGYVMEIEVNGSMSNPVYKATLNNIAITLYKRETKLYGIVPYELKGLSSTVLSVEFENATVNATVSIATVGVMNQAIADSYLLEYADLFTVVYNDMDTLPAFEDFYTYAYFD